MLLRSRGILEEQKVFKLEERLQCLSYLEYALRGENNGA